MNQKVARIGKDNPEDHLEERGRDVSNQIVLDNQSLDMAYRDTLTGLGNRKAFEDQLAVACRVATDSQ
jgi:GGDEF domain-containing protein